MPFISPPSVAQWNTFDQNDYLDADSDGECTAASLYWIMQNMQAQASRASAENIVYRSIQRLKADFRFVVRMSKAHERRFTGEAVHIDQRREQMVDRDRWARNEWSSDSVRRARAEVDSLIAQLRALPTASPGYSGLMDRLMALVRQVKALDAMVERSGKRATFFRDQARKLAGAAPTPTPDGNSAVLDRAAIRSKLLQQAGVEAAHADGHLADLAVRFMLRFCGATKGLRSSSVGQHFQSAIPPDTHFLYVMTHRRNGFDGEVRKREPGHALGGYRTSQVMRDDGTMASDLYLFDPNRGAHRVSFESEAAKLIHHVHHVDYGMAFEEWTIHRVNATLHPSRSGRHPLMAVGKDLRPKERWPGAYA